jgi:hypothetical protein
MVRVEGARKASEWEREGALQPRVQFSLTDDQMIATTRGARPLIINLAPTPGGVSPSPPSPVHPFLRECLAIVSHVPS